MTSITEYGELMLKAKMDEWGNIKFDSIREDGIKILGVAPPPPTPTPPAWLDDAMEKYRRELSHVKLRPQITELIPKIDTKTAISQAQMHRIKMKVKDILDKEGIYSDYHPFYYAYALALDKSQRTMEFMVDRIREHQILRERWETRGLDPAILDKIDDVLIFAQS